MVLTVNIEIQDITKEFKLTEKISTDAMGITKKEVLIIILDYLNCKWRKVKRTTKINNPHKINN